MNLKTYNRICFIVLVILGYEYWMLNETPHGGIFRFLVNHLEPMSKWNTSPAPGRPLSMFLGWSGIGVMLFTNLYVFRKRIPIIQNWGSLTGWLDFHIFCGLLGPTFILFHSNFTVHGFVAISFWSMIIAAASGVVGRYLYMQVLSVKSDLQNDVERYENSLNTIQKSLATTVPATVWESAKASALGFVGAGSVLKLKPGEVPGFTTSFLMSMIGDLRLAFSSPTTGPGIPLAAQPILKDFALARRKVIFYDVYKQYLGYWHAFHVPFALIMYGTAALHIAAELALQVKR